MEAFPTGLRQRGRGITWKSKHSPTFGSCVRHARRRQFPSAVSVDRRATCAELGLNLVRQPQFRNSSSRLTRCNSSIASRIRRHSGHFGDLRSHFTAQSHSCSPANIAQSLANTKGRPLLGHASKTKPVKGGASTLPRPYRTLWSIEAVARFLLGTSCPTSTRLTVHIPPAPNPKMNKIGQTARPELTAWGNIKHVNRATTVVAARRPRRLIRSAAQPIGS